MYLCMYLFIYSFIHLFIPYSFIRLFRYLLANLDPVSTLFLNSSPNTRLSTAHGLVRFPAPVWASHASAIWQPPTLYAAAGVFILGF
jgi:hypothetical protein